MKKLDLSQAITVLANLGVIAGIVFLGIELNQNNEFLAAQARYSLRVQRMDAVESANSAYVMEALHKYASGETLTPDEISAARSVALRIIGLWEWQHGEYRAGMLELNELPVASWRQWFNGESVFPVPIEEVWKLRRDVSNPDFVQFLEENVVNGR